MVSEVKLLSKVHFEHLAGALALQHGSDLVSAGEVALYKLLKRDLLDFLIDLEFARNHLENRLELDA